MEMREAVRLRRKLRRVETGKGTKKEAARAIALLKNKTIGPDGYAHRDAEVRGPTRLPARFAILGQKAKTETPTGMGRPAPTQ